MLLWLHALLLCVAAHILLLFLYFFCTVIPYILQHFNGNVLTLVLLIFCCILACKNNTVYTRAQAPPLLLL